MKRILIITYYWPPSGGSGVQRWLKFAKYLPDYGYEPIILTVDPEKASYPVIDESLVDEIPHNTKVYKTNTREPFDFYRKYIGKGSYPHSSFDSERTPSFTQKVSRFIRGNFFIPDSRIGWKPFAVKEGMKLIEDLEISYVVTTGPPHSVHLTGLELKKKMNIKWIADFRDPWTDIFFYDQFYHTQIAGRIDANYEKKVIANSDYVFIVSRALREQLVNKYPEISPEKIFVIPNGFDPQDFEIPSKPPKNEFIVTFTGNLANDNQKLDVFIEALSEIKELYPDIPTKFRFIGNIDKSVNDVFGKGGIENILEIISYLPHKDAVRYIMNGTACFLVIRRTEKNKGILSGKIFDYLGSGKPIICIGPENGNIADLLDECQAGIVIDYEDKPKMIKYLSALFEQWKKDPDIDRQKEQSLKYSRKEIANNIVSIL